jgi:hypothetical protein
MAGLMGSSRTAVALLAAIVWIAAGMGLLGGCQGDKGTGQAPPSTGKKGEEPAAKAKGWVDLFDGKTLTGWKASDFADHGKIVVKDGQLILERGNGDLTGVTWAGGELPKIDYEITLEAMRVDGGDFFCGLTFPVKDSCCSLIVGGWGGGLVGLSCLDGFDAANNETTKMMTFENGKWYSLRVRVTEAKIEAWIDGAQVVDAGIAGRKINVRWEVEPSQPLGLAAWRTAGAVRDLQMRRLNE